MLSFDFMFDKLLARNRTEKGKQWLLKRVAVKVV